jgi:hypothetical protein
VLLVGDLSRLTDEQLLDTRLCDLPLSLKGTPLERRMDQLYQELHARGLLFKPHVWLSEEWFTPDNIPGFAIPFYLAHPRLSRLERKQMLEVEGGIERDCLRIMRHEAGHAIDNAFHLYARRRYRELFGSFARPYPHWYKPEPNSRDHVFHLPAWYAQAHPAEDFAETFAVWITPRLQWKKRYEGWPALRKLEYVDQSMKALVGQAPTNASRETVEELGEITITLREHYHRKRQYYAFQWPPDYDQNLLRIFSSESQQKSRLNGLNAASFLRRHRRQLCREVAAGTGVHNYAIDQMLGHLITRCQELKLRVALSEENAFQRALVLVTVQTLNGIRSGYHRIAYERNTEK